MKIITGMLFLFCFGDLKALSKSEIVDILGSFHEISWEEIEKSEDQRRVLQQTLEEIIESESTNPNLDPLIKQRALAAYGKFITVDQDGKIDPKSLQFLQRIYEQGMEPIENSRVKLLLLDSLAKIHSLEAAKFIIKGDNFFEDHSTTLYSLQTLTEIIKENKSISSSPIVSTWMMERLNQITRKFSDDLITKAMIELTAEIHKTPYTSKTALETSGDTAEELKIVSENNEHNKRTLSTENITKNPDNTSKNSIIWIVFLIIGIIGTIIKVRLDRFSR